MTTNLPVLVVIYNHNYEENVARLRSLYALRFSKVFHLMPFYRGTDPDVIRVDEHSHRFQGYIAQGFHRFFQEGTSHYIFIADDLMLNPEIDETNYREYFNLKDDAQSFIPELKQLHQVDHTWLRFLDAVKYNQRCKGVEVEKLLPSVTEATTAFAKHGLEVHPIKTSRIYGDMRIPRIRTDAWLLLHYFWYWITRSKNGKINLNYPLVAGYSDICIVSGNSIADFTHYCGIFAATNLFVEVAIPTALVLASEGIVTESNALLPGMLLWTEEEKKKLEPFEGSLSKLMQNFPENTYIHPVKLSGLSM